MNPSDNLLHSNMVAPFSKVPLTQHPSREQIVALEMAHTDLSSGILQHRVRPLIVSRVGESVHVVAQTILVLERGLKASWP